MVVPASAVTPVLLMVIVPTPLVMPIAVPAVRFASANPEPLPIRSCPFVALPALTPVPPCAAVTAVSEPRTPLAVVTMPSVVKPVNLICPAAVIAPMFERSPTPLLSVTVNKVFVPFPTLNT